MKDLAKTRSTSAAAGGHTSRSLEADLKALGWSPEYRQSSRLARTVEALVGELAVLSEIADGNRSVPTDAGRRYRELHVSVPSFDASGAQQALDESEKRLWREYEKLAGKARRPAMGEKGKCESCRRRRVVLADYCAPCGADILKQHRRQQ